MQLLASQRVFYLFTKGLEAVSAARLQCGAGAGTRHFKKAVDRNHIKRLIRENYRLQKEPLVQRMKGGRQLLAVFIIYTGKELPEANTVKEKLAVILQKLINIADENITANN